MDASLLSSRRVAPLSGAACAALTTLMHGGAKAFPPRHCSEAGSGPWATVGGAYRGRHLAVAFAEAGAQTETQSHEVMALGMGYGSA
jgi:hypothetical protein